MEKYKVDNVELIAEEKMKHESKVKVEMAKIAAEEAAKAEVAEKALIEGNEKTGAEGAAQASPSQTTATTS